MQKGYESLVQINGVGPSMADALFEKGLYSAEELANAFNTRWDRSIEPVFLEQAY